jgi:hypothetical protein
MGSWWQLSGLPVFRRGTTAPLQGPGEGRYPPCHSDRVDNALCASMFVALAGSELTLWMVHSDNHFLALAFFQTLVLELAVDTFFGPILQGAAATLGKPFDRHGAAILNSQLAQPG